MGSTSEDRNMLKSVTYMATIEFKLNYGHGGGPPPFRVFTVQPNIIGRPTDRVRRDGDCKMCGKSARHSIVIPSHSITVRRVVPRRFMQELAAPPCYLSTQGFDAERFPFFRF